MARIDRLKEEIGWLKVPFGVLVVVDASLLGWLAQLHAEVHPVLVLTGIVATIVVTGAVFWINRSAFRRMQRVEES
jgi:hypothetical protein